MQHIGTLLPPIGFLLLAVSLWPHRRNRLLALIGLTWLALGVALLILPLNPWIGVSILAINGLQRIRIEQAS